MAHGCEMMMDWVVETLKQLGGRGSILEISRHVWEMHEEEIRAAGDLLYNWQYEFRWAADLFRKAKILRSVADAPKGIWELA